MYLLWGVVTVLKIPTYSTQKIVVFDRNDKSICSIQKRNCKYVKYEDIPEQLKKQIIIVEDVGFFSHVGISVISILRSIITAPIYILSNKRTPGGSTITQQLVRSFFLTSNVSLIRKFNEIFLAVIFNIFYSKEKTFEYYFNNIYFGNGIYGFFKAAKYYFNCQLENLNPNQAATLVAMIKSSLQYSPIYQQEQLLQRKQYVLQRWYSYKMINKDTLNKYYNSIPYITNYLNQSNSNKFRYAHLYSHILGKIRDNQSTEKVQKIFLTLDDYLQSLSYNTLNKHCKKLELKLRWQGPIGKTCDYNNLKNFHGDSKDIQAIMMLEQNGQYMDHKGKINMLSSFSLVNYKDYGRILPGDVVLINKNTGMLCNQSTITGHITIIGTQKHNMGHLLASVGTHNWQENKYNLSASNRPVSSCLKIFLLAHMFENHLTALNTEVRDLPGICYNDKFYYISRNIHQHLVNKEFDCIWVPKNWDNQFMGRMTIIDAFSESRNIPFLNMGLNHVGLENLNNFLMDLGIIKKPYMYPSLILGSCWDISMEDFLVKCCTFSNNGLEVEKKIIKYWENTNHEQCHMVTSMGNDNPIFSQETIYQVLFAMRHNFQQGLSALVNKLPYENIYLKTGTSHNTKDYHCVILTKEYAISVSLCTLDNSSMKGKVTQRDLLNIVVDLLSKLRLSDEPIMHVPHTMKIVNRYLKNHATKQLEKKSFPIYKSQYAKPSIMTDCGYDPIVTMDDLEHLIENSNEQSQG